MTSRVRVSSCSWFDRVGGIKCRGSERDTTSWETKTRLERADTCKITNKVMEQVSNQYSMRCDHESMKGNGQENSWPRRAENSIPHTQITLWAKNEFSPGSSSRKGKYRTKLVSSSISCSHTLANKSVEQIDSHRRSGTSKSTLLSSKWRISRLIYMIWFDSWLKGACLVSPRNHSNSYRIR